MLPLTIRTCRSELYETVQSMYETVRSIFKPYKVGKVWKPYKSRVSDDPCTNVRFVRCILENIYGNFFMICLIKDIKNFLTRREKHTVHFVHSYKIPYFSTGLACTK